jgi:putative membrane protein insertion efficiency factor
MNRLALKAIGLYRKLAFLFPIKCAYFPTCSEYSKQAFGRYPFFKALRLSLGRILRCHPFCKGGYDPLK